MRIGVYGLKEGHISGMFRAAKAARNGQIVGIVEPDDALYEKYTAGAAIPRYASLDEMLAKARPELLLEGCHHAAKTEFVEKGAAAGAHLLLDKPLCRSLEDWDRMKRAVTTHGVHLSMWFTSRSHPPFVTLRERILAGELGELVSYISTHPHHLGSRRPDWYFDPNIYTGTFHDLACHGVDQVHWLSGAEFTGVHALQTTMKHTDPPIVDHIQASFQLSNGAGALLTADWLTPDSAPSFGDTRFIIMGTQGSAHLRAYAGDHLLICSDPKGTYEVPLVDTGRSTFVEDMIDAIERGEPLFIPTQSVFDVAQACLIAQESAKRGGEFLPIRPDGAVAS